MPPVEHSFLLPNLNATQNLAAQIAPHLQVGDCVALVGDLGAGKTTFARALLQVIGVKGDVPSPTFTLLQTYDVDGLQIAHFDLYRLQSPDELDELGWDDALADGITLVEWPERAGDRMPTKTLVLALTILPDGGRHCSMTGNI